MPSLTNHLYAFGEFRLDPQHRTLWLGEEPIALTPKAFEVLLLLIRHSGQIVSKDELMRAVWPDSFVEESNLTQTVFMLRKALGETPKQRYILTSQGRGYRFAADVEEVSGNLQVRAAPSAHPPRIEASGTTQAGRRWSNKLPHSLISAGRVLTLRSRGPADELCWLSFRSRI
jgi:DNA-binding winged helix-turn-helix (wHTH) protein